MTTSARVSAAGLVTKLDARTQPSTVVLPKDVQDPESLAQTITSIVSDAQDLKRRFVPRRVEFEDQTVGAGVSGTTLRLAHNFNGRVRWSVVDWVCSTSAAWILRKDTANTTAN